MKNQANLRLFAGLLSLVMAVVIMAIKYYAYHLSQSTAVLSDAMESIVNVVAAAFALWAVKAAQDPPDQEHPYGHGKFEFVTAIFEGGLISFAAFMIALEAIQSFLNPQPLLELNSGLYLLTFAGVLNGVLGYVLIRIGKSTRSVALTADGKHVISDCMSSVGIVLGLIVVKFTGLHWLDPLMALLAAVYLAYTGIPLMRHALDGLIDAADKNLLQQLCQSLEDSRSPGMIRLHHVRMMKNGRSLHVDGHLVVPEFWPVDQAHDEMLIFENRTLKKLGWEGEMEFHLDPCRKAYCSSCEIKDCPIRLKPFEVRPGLTVPEMVSTVDITDRL